MSAIMISASMVKILREQTGAAILDCKKALVATEGDHEAAIQHLRKSGIVKAAKRSSKIAAEGRICLAISSDTSSAFIVEVNCETDFVSRSDDFIGFADQVAQLGLQHKACSVESLGEAQYQPALTIEQHRQTLVQKIGENIQLRRSNYLASEGVVGAYIHGSRIGVLVSLDQPNEQLARDIAMHIAANNPMAISEQDIPQHILAQEKVIYLAQAEESGKPAEIVAKMVEGRIKKFIKENTLLSQAFVKDQDETIASLLTTHKCKLLQFVRYEVGEGVEKVTQDFADEVMAQVAASK